MVILMVVVTVAVFVVVDLSLRLILRRVEEARERRERQQALDIGLRLEFAEVTKSLKRVEVPSPRARILAVDDEPVVLDSFRKILVLAGFSVDTVESGPEALALVRAHEYDILFTDLKMPGMDGLDVTKGVKHLRPDIDVAIITGYATVETAVNAMQYGAVDYVQKPFTEDELVAFANRLLIRRQDRLERLALPEIRVVTPSSAGVDSPRVINIPGGVYVSKEHSWVSVEMTGEGRIGLDDLFQKTVGPPDEIEFPEIGRKVRIGQPLFKLRKGVHSMTFRSPLGGRVSRVNHELEYHLELMRLRPYELGWICAVEPTDLTGDLSGLTIGADAATWYVSETESYRSRLAEEFASIRPAGRQTETESELKREASWRAFAACFLGPSDEPEAALASAAVDRAPRAEPS